MSIPNNQGISAHGTTIEIQPSATPGVWTPITQIGDIQMPGLMRNEHDITSHDKDIDTYILGVLRRDPVTFPLFFNKLITSHVMLQTAIDTNDVCGFRFTSPDGQVMIMSGGVQGMKETAPVDGAKTANVTLRLTGGFIRDGVARP